MTLNEAKAVIYGNVVYACEKAGFPPETTRLVQDACDTIIALANACETIVALAGSKTEPQIEVINDSSVLVKDLVDDEFNPYDEECMRCKHLKLKCEFVPSYCKYELRDEPQTRLTAKCLECNNSKTCKENHWEGCKYEPLDCEVTAVVGTIKDEPQTMRDENYIYAYDKTHGEWYPIQEIERPCDNCQEWDCYGCDYKQVKRSDK